MKGKTGQDGVMPFKIASWDDDGWVVEVGTNAEGSMRTRIGLIDANTMEKQVQVSHLLRFRHILWRISPSFWAIPPSVGAFHIVPNLVAL